MGRLSKNRSKIAQRFYRYCAKSKIVLRLYFHGVELCRCLPPDRPGRMSTQSGSVFGMVLLKGKLLTQSLPLTPILVLLMGICFSKYPIFSALLVLLRSSYLTFDFQGLQNERESRGHSRDLASNTV